MERPSDRIVGALSAVDSTVRRSGAEVAGIAVVTGLILAAAALGVRVPDDDLLPGLPRRAPTERAAAVLGPLASISQDYVRKTLGDEVFRRLAGTAPAGGVGSRGDVDPRPGPTGGPAASQGITGEPGVLPELVPGGWVLTLDMVADRAVVEPGGEFEFRMTIRNVGAEDFRGRSFVLQWHTPLGTAGHDPTRCDEELRDMCVPSPGLGDLNHEQTHSGGLISIPAGGEWVKRWTVRTSPRAAPGTEYASHAHLRAGGEAITTETVTVTVSE